MPSVFAFLFHLGRELIKDMEDVEADRAAGIGTGAVIYGLRATTVVASAVIVLLIVATIAPYLIRGILATGTYGGLYLAIALIGVDIFLVYGVLRLILSPGKKKLPLYRRPDETADAARPISGVSGEQGGMRGEVLVGQNPCGLDYFI